MEKAEIKDKLIGYSAKINDEAFLKYVKKTNRFVIIFSVLAAIVSMVGFYMAGLKTREMSMTESIAIGCGIALMFLIIGACSVLSRKKSNTWDGEVVDKKIKKKTETQGTDENTYYINYLVYQVKIKGKNGKKKVLKWKNIDTVYNYYQIGDKVRYHGLLKTFEKYDKTKDKIIFCNACLSKCKIEDDYCSRCKCPILK